MFFVRNEILSHILADSSLVIFLMTKLIWKLLVKSLRMTCTKQHFSVSLCLSLCVIAIHMFPGEESAFRTPLLYWKHARTCAHTHTLTHTLPLLLVGLDYECWTSNEEFHESSNEECLSIDSKLFRPFPLKKFVPFFPSNCLSWFYLK